MKYKIVIGVNIADLEQQVNIYLDLGWTLQGGVSCEGTILYQAMIKI